MTPRKSSQAPQQSVSKKHQKLIQAAKSLSQAVDAMQFHPPVTHVYNPLNYAWAAHRQYLLRCNVESTRVLFLGMNPGPWGMAQTGVPFGQVAAVRDWLGISAKVECPDAEHPKRPVEGFDCQRSEVSGERLWGLFKRRFDTADSFFAEHFVTNYCPLVFMELSGKNRTPDKLTAAEILQLRDACDQHLVTVVELLTPEFLVGVGAYAEQCFQRIIPSLKLDLQHLSRLCRILHPSPASPAANRNWEQLATEQLYLGGVWS